MHLISIIIPTNKPFAIWKPLLQCIAQQTYPDLEVVLCVDRVITGSEFDTISNEIHTILDPAGVTVSLITSHNTSFVAGKGASYVRNYGAEVARGVYIQYMDDDGLREHDYIQRMVQRYLEVSSALGKDCITSPTIMYRDTDQIQSQGFDRIRWGLCRPQPHHATDWKSRLVNRLQNYTSSLLHVPSSFYVSCIGAMGLFAPRELFQVITFDEQFEFVYEDLDMTLTAHQAGVSIVVHDDIRIQHMESPRTRAQRSYVGSPRMVYLKSRNRIFFVHNHAPWRGKLVFYAVGLPLHIIWFICKIGLYGSSRLLSWWMLLRGTRDGICTYQS